MSSEPSFHISVFHLVLYPFFPSRESSFQISDQNTKNLSVLQDCNQAILEFLPQSPLVICLKILTNKGLILLGVFIMSDFSSYVFKRDMVNILKFRGKENAGNSD